VNFSKLTCRVVAATIGMPLFVVADDETGPADLVKSVQASFWNWHARWKAKRFIPRTCWACPIRIRDLAYWNALVAIHLVAIHLAAIHLAAIHLAVTSSERPLAEVERKMQSPDWQEQVQGTMIIATPTPTELINGLLD